MCDQFEQKQSFPNHKREGHFQNPLVPEEVSCDIRQVLDSQEDSSNQVKGSELLLSSNRQLDIRAAAGIQFSSLNNNNQEVRNHHHQATTTGEANVELGDSLEGRCASNLLPPGDGSPMISAQKSVGRFFESKATSQLQFKFQILPLKTQVSSNLMANGANVTTNVTSVQDNSVSSPHSVARKGYDFGEIRNATIKEEKSSSENSQEEKKIAPRPFQIVLERISDENKDSDKDKAAMTEQVTAQLVSEPKFILEEGETQNNNTQQRHNTGTEAVRYSIREPTGNNTAQFFLENTFNQRLSNETQRVNLARNEDEKVDNHSASSIHCQINKFKDDIAGPFLPNLIRPTQQMFSPLVKYQLQYPPVQTLQDFGSEDEEEGGEYDLCEYMNRENIVAAGVQLSDSIHHQFVSFRSLNKDALNQMLKNVSLPSRQGLPNGSDSEIKDLCGEDRPHIKYESGHATGNSFAPRRNNFHAALSMGHNQNQLSSHNGAGGSQQFEGSSGFASNQFDSNITPHSLQLSASHNIPNDSSENAHSDDSGVSLNQRQGAIVSFAREIITQDYNIAVKRNRIIATMKLDIIDSESEYEDDDEEGSEDSMFSQINNIRISEDEEFIDSEEEDYEHEILDDVQEEQEGYESDNENGQEGPDVALSIREPARYRQLQSQLQAVVPSSGNSSSAEQNLSENVDSLHMPVISLKRLLKDSFNQNSGNEALESCNVQGQSNTCIQAPVRHFLVQRVARRQGPVHPVPHTQVPQVNAQSLPLSMSSAAVVELQNLSLALQAIAAGPSDVHQQLLVVAAPIQPLSVSLQVETSQLILDAPDEEDVDEDIFAKVQHRVNIDDVLERRGCMADRWSSPSQMNMQHINLQRLDFDSPSPRGLNSRMIASF